jgi:hypothetical protein
LVEGIRQRLLQDSTVVRPAHSLEPGVNRPSLVARAVSTERGPEHASDEFGLTLVLRRGPRRVEQGERVYRSGGIEGKLESDHRARGVADDVHSLHPEVADEASDNAQPLPES